MITVSFAIGSVVKHYGHQSLEAPVQYNESKFLHACRFLAKSLGAFQRSGEQKKYWSSSQVLRESQKLNNRQNRMMQQDIRENSLYNMCGGKISIRKHLKC